MMVVVNTEKLGYKSTEDLVKAWERATTVEERLQVGEDLDKVSNFGTDGTWQKQ
jgi:hypothetical protein